MESATSSLEAMLKQHGLNPTSFLGQGLHGIAFLDASGDVIKVSVADDEAAARRHVDELLRVQAKASKAFVDILDVGMLGRVELPGGRGWVRPSGIAFYYVMERAKPVPEDEVRLANKIVNELFTDPSNKKKIMFVARRVLKRDGEDEGIAERALALFDEMVKDNVKHSDINKGALMKREDGSYCLIDLESARVIQ